MNTPVTSLIREKINAELKAYESHNLLFKPDERNISLWKNRFVDTPLFSKNSEVNVEILQNFRQQKLFVGDNPTFNSSVDGMLNPSETKKRRILVSLVKELKFIEYLSKYPMPMTGNPSVYSIDLRNKTFVFTHRWVKHLYALKLFDKYIDPFLDKNFTSMDIGASFGIYQYLLKLRRPDAHQVLIDLPEQLILARYFLQSCFPHAKIAGVEEIIAIRSIERGFIKEYDFVLVPSDLYHRLGSDAIDFTSSFACLGELKREYFDYYTKHPAFNSSKVFHLINPIAGHPIRKSRITGETDISLLDYDCVTNAMKVYFSLSPVYIMTYNPTAVSRLEPFFEYIGKKY